MSGSLIWLHIYAIVRGRLVCKKEGVVMDEEVVEVGTIIVWMRVSDWNCVRRRLGVECVCFHLLHE